MSNVPAIYRYVLNQPGTRPKKTLFIDNQVNIEAARAVGMKGILFSNVARQRDDLVAQGFDADLALPA